MKFRFSTTVSALLLLLSAFVHEANGQEGVGLCEDCKLVADTIHKQHERDGSLYEKDMSCVKDCLRIVVNDVAVDGAGRQELMAACPDICKDRGTIQDGSACNGLCGHEGQDKCANCCELTNRLHHRNIKPCVEYCEGISNGPSFTAQECKNICTTVTTTVNEAILPLCKGLNFCAFPCHPPTEMALHASF